MRFARIIATVFVSFFAASALAADYIYAEVPPSHYAGCLKCSGTSVISNYPGYYEWPPCTSQGSGAQWTYTPNGLNGFRLINSGLVGKALMLLTDGTVGLSTYSSSEPRQIWNVYLSCPSANAVILRSNYSGDCLFVNQGSYPYYSGVVGMATCPASCPGTLSGFYFQSPLF